jgi:hypothetical protein
MNGCEWDTDGDFKLDLDMVHLMQCLCRTLVSTIRNNDEHDSKYRFNPIFYGAR